MQAGTILRQDDLPEAWCPWHVHFYCQICGEVWLHRLHAGQAVHTYRALRCPSCPTELDYYGLPEPILNAYERDNGYLPIELLSLEFLISSQESYQWLTHLRQQS